MDAGPDGRALRASEGRRVATLALAEGGDGLGQVDDERGDVVAVGALDLSPPDDRAHDEQVRGVRGGHALAEGVGHDAHRLGKG